MRGWCRARLGAGAIAVLVTALLTLGIGASTAAARSTHARHSHGAKRVHVHKRTLRPRKTGGLDCNGESHIQRTWHRAFACTDVRGMKGHTRNLWEHRFYDNGVYIGHDEPDMTFLSSQPGSGNDVTWTETLGADPSAAPTVSTPGSDVTHYFELTVAPWFSMDMCDPNSYPFGACKPLSDSNAPNCPSHQARCEAGGGSAFMEMQFYPPGMPPFVDSTSCDDAHWCAALTIDSLECAQGFRHCNPNCTEPVNFAFIQKDGVPAGPPSPQEANLASFTQNDQTLMMNPGDRIKVHMFDALVPGGHGQRAFKVVIDDLATGESGSMQASAANGFADTSVANCSGTPFNFQPEYNTAAKGNISPWAALQTNISTQFEIGHFVPCSSVTNPINLGFDTTYGTCNGPYEDNSQAELGEPSDAFCYPAGDTHGSLNTAPDVMNGCMDNFAQNGDLDYDGTPYYADWPTGASPTTTTPGSFVQDLPLTGGSSSYPSYFVQTDAALSETTCTAANAAGCTVPPQGPGGFYPYWSRVSGASSGGGCALEFGNVSSSSGSGINDLGGDAQYGQAQLATLGFSEFEGPVMPNSTC